MLADRPIPTYPDLAGRVALVTGGSKGIGADTCRVLAANRVKVAVNARSQPGIDALVTELRDAGAEAIGISADVRDIAEIERMHEQVRSELGPVDILLPFAGGFGAFTPVQDISVEEWRDVIDANLTSTFLTVRAVVPSMMERRRGVIVTMSSNGGRFLDKLLTASYAAAKAGVIQFTRHIAMELGPHGVRANVDRAGDGELGAGRADHGRAEPGQGGRGCLRSGRWARRSTARSRRSSWSRTPPAG